MDINTTTITVGSVFAFVGIALTIWSFVRSNKRDIQVKATDYAMLKSNVETLQETVKELKGELSENRKEWREELRQLDEQLMKKVNTIDTKLDDLIKMLLKK